MHSYKTNKKRKQPRKRFTRKVKGGTRLGKWLKQKFRRNKVAPINDNRENWTFNQPPAEQPLYAYNPDREDIYAAPVRYNSNSSSKRRKGFELGFEPYARLNLGSNSSPHPLGNAPEYAALNRVSSSDMPEEETGYAVLNRPGNLNPITGYAALNRTRTGNLNQDTGYAELNRVNSEHEYAEIADLPGDSLLVNKRSSPKPAPPIPAGLVKRNVKNFQATTQRKPSLPKTQRKKSLPKTQRIKGRRLSSINRSIRGKEALLYG